MTTPAPTTPRAPGRGRRSQGERTAQARSLLIDAAVAVLHRSGYSGATTAAIASEAGLSRALITHHFGSRNQLMADVIAAVYEREQDEYREQATRHGRGRRLSDWPSLLWDVLSKPSGLAVLEILQASRNDRDLAALVGPMQARIEERALGEMDARFGTSDAAETLAVMRLLVWAARGLSIAQVLIPDPDGIGRSIAYLTGLLKGAERSRRDGEGAPGPRD